MIARGRLTFWFDEETVVAWRNTDPQSGRGAPKVYSDTAIQFRGDYQVYGTESDDKSGHA